MKLTKTKLKQIIKEEIQNVLKEGFGGFDEEAYGREMEQEHLLANYELDTANLAEQVRHFRNQPLIKKFNEILSNPASAPVVRKDWFMLMKKLDIITTSLEKNAASLRAGTGPIKEGRRDSAIGYHDISNISEGDGTLNNMMTALHDNVHHYMRKWGSDYKSLGAEHSEVGISDVKGSQVTKGLTALRQQEKGRKIAAMDMKISEEFYTFLEGAKAHLASYMNWNDNRTDVQRAPIANRYYMNTLRMDDPRLQKLTSL